AAAVLVGDGGGAAAERAGAQPCRGGAEKGRHGRRGGGQRGHARFVAPSREGGPVGSVEPHRLRCARASESRRFGPTILREQEGTRNRLCLHVQAPPRLSRTPPPAARLPASCAKRSDSGGLARFGQV